MALDLDGCGKAISELDFEQNLALASPPRTFLDVSRTLLNWWSVQPSHFHRTHLILLDKLSARNCEAPIEAPSSLSRRLAS